MTVSVLLAVRWFLFALIGTRAIVRLVLVSDNGSGLLLACMMEQIWTMSEAELRILGMKGMLLACCRSAVFKRSKTSGVRV